MTNTKSKKKTAKQKHVLGLAMVLAVIIAVGSTFAWFTSTDTVTNKLSASGDYAVYITETFTPTEDLTPGTQVNKDVSVVNAGNVDAFVRVSLDNTLELTTVDSTGEAFSDSNVADYITMTADEAKAMSAGGFLAYYSGNGTVTTGAVGSVYTPTASGYYIFRREITAGDPTTYEYVGYYCVYDNSAGTPTRTYYELGTLPTFTIGTDGAITGINSGNLVVAKTSTTTCTTSSSPAMTFDYDNVYSGYITATYGSTDDEKIKVNIYLASGWSDSWQLVTDSYGAKAFYLKDDLEAGATSAQLIDYIELDSSVKETAYYSFDYNLDVTVDSVQVTVDANGNETNTAVASAWPTVQSGLTYDSSVTTEISKIDWSVAD